MKITNISIESFRNFSTANFSFGNKTFIYGANGSGKSSIIESIYYFTHLKSFRNTPDIKIIKSNEKQSLIYMKGEKETIPIEMGIKFSNGKKDISINNKRIDKISNAFGFFLSIVFSVQDKLLAESSPYYRRRYIDKIISLIDRNYFEYLIKYHNILKNRNYILKNSNDKKLLDVYAKQLSQYADYIYMKRLEFTDYFIEIINNVFNEIFEYRVKVDFLYYSSKDNGEYRDISLYDKLNLLKQKEIEKQRTLAGVHLDDYIIKLNNKSISKIGSEGEKRLIGLALKYAELILIYENYSEYPVILIDDAFAEIDKNKTERLLKIFDQYPQVIITSPIKDNILKYKEILLV